MNNISQMNFIVLIENVLDSKIIIVNYIKDGDGYNYLIVVGNNIKTPKF